MEYLDAGFTNNNNNKIEPTNLWTKNEPHVDVNFECFIQLVFCFLSVQCSVTWLIDK